MDNEVYSYIHDLCLDCSLLQFEINGSTLHVTGLEARPIKGIGLKF